MAKQRNVRIDLSVAGEPTADDMRSGGILHFEQETAIGSSRTTSQKHKVVQ